MYKNYTLVEQRELGSIGAEGYLYKHVSGARVLYLKSRDDNKVFSATFRTPPVDETGVAHIMEHCVLNGSQKYPLKDPFNELANGSLCTFLNAMTYPDRTTYPVASVNDKDFLILMDVYLDAVFFPKIYDRKESLLQEGWHYQLEETDGELKYNGIVYNEMKGAYSDPQGLLSDALNRALFPDAVYALDAGGNPDCIPDLSYEAFVGFHKKFYHPENAFIYFYGNMDIEHCFAKLDEEYLSKFAAQGLEVDVKAQKPLTGPVFARDVYSVADEEGLAENYMAMSVAMPTDMLPRDIAAMKLLYYILMSTPASPLYKALVEAEIGEDIGGYCSADIMHPVLRISMKNGQVTLNELKALIDNILTNIVQTGLDKDFVAACMNYAEFQAREEDFGYWPKGLVYNERALTGWLYGKSPFDSLMGLAYLAEIRELCEKGGYLEGLIREHILNNPNQAYVEMQPVLDLDGQKEQAVEEKLAGLKKQMSGEEIERVIEDYRALKHYQDTPDTEEIINLIPRVAVADIKKEIEKTPLNIVREGGLNMLNVPLATNDIVYITMLFDIQAIPTEELPLVRVLQHILSKLSTKNYSTTGITQAIKGNLGGLSFTQDIISKTQHDFMPRAVVSGKFLSKNADKMFEIAGEIIQNTLFADRSQIKNYVMELKAAMEDMFLTSGALFAVERAASYFSAAAAYNDRLNGLHFYEYIKALADNFDSRFEELQAQLAGLAQKIYGKNNVCYGIVADEELYVKTIGHLRSFHAGLTEQAMGPGPGLGHSLPAVKPKNEGFITASKVQYCAMAADIFADGHNYSGGLKVLSNVLDDFLYDEIRVKGGAYGFGSNFGSNGGMYFYSYRDPGLDNTFETFKRTAEYVRNLDLSPKEVEKFIIGTIRGYDRPVSNAHKGLRAITYHLLGFNDEMRQKERDEILAANAQGLKGLADVLAGALAQNNLCAVGSDTAINQSGGLFGAVRRI